ncbi:MMPL family transporter [Aldersonia sp. NBC_00410]|uniref:MMPL family transporter n=1 Tax=Aldersonia sp. NBC_00410 TaxID=2975954 RepID=UPI002258EEDA|nr:MMPL family transporter [Aldersonia sp. NBC_00410]MCX5043065.1 MMPL family transporter [Aldersonia sp. NBC_00410]
MLDRIAYFVIARPRAVLVAALLIAVSSGLLGATALAHMKAGGFIANDSESGRASALLAEKFGGAEPNFILLVDAPDGVDSPAARATGARIIESLRSTSDVDSVQSYWTMPPDLAAAFRSRTAHSALITAHIDGDDTAAPARAAELADEVAGTSDGITVRASGIAIGYHEINGQVTKDLAIAEGVAIPISAIVLILVFGSVIAAMLPLAIGIFAILSTLAILRFYTMITDVSIYALNMTTALGFALAIDYSLFMVSRFREELAAGREVPDAVVRTVQTAGRTVLYSAIVVALSMSALIVFPLYFLKSFAYAGLAVVAAAALAALILVPACLMLLGHRVNSFDLREPLRRLFRMQPSRVVPPEESRWYSAVNAVMRRAAPVAIAATIFLLFLGAPFLSAKFSYPDDRVVPAAVSETRAVGDSLRQNFDINTGGAAIAVLPGYAAGPGPLGDYAAELSRVPGVLAVSSSVGTYTAGARVASALPEMANESGTYLRIISDASAYSATAARQLHAARAVPAPGEVMFTGPAAANNDSLDALGGRLPLALALIVASTLIVLFLFTGSVILPIKAVVLNTLSLSAGFGAMVWIFQEGHFSDPLGFTPTGYLSPTMPLLMFCLAFGMSMDYEVFLLSRIREDWLQSGRTTADNTHAVAMGIARTGRIFTAAAMLMSISFIALATAQVSFMKMFGIVLAITLVVDATLIRAGLAPALMRMMGPANWWAPKPLARLHDRFGLHEHDAPAPRSSAPAEAVPVH